MRDIGKYLKTLELNAVPDREELKKQMRKLLFQWHPDRNSERTKIAEQKSKDILEAYNSLKAIAREPVTVQTENRCYYTGASADGSVTLEKHLLFEYDGICMATEIDCIKEIIPLNSVTVERQTYIDDNIYCGYFNYKGDIVSVINISYVIKNNNLHYKWQNSVNPRQQTVAGNSGFIICNIAGEIAAIPAEKIFGIYNDIDVVSVCSLLYELAVA